MRRGDVREALGAARRLRRSPAEGARLEVLREAFLALLDRRGYFVETPAQIEASLREIREVGPGFDLYDLVEALPELKELPHGS